MDLGKTPRNLSATKNGSNQIDLRWNAPKNRRGLITGYRIERESPLGGGFVVIVKDTGNSNVTYPDTGLSPNTEYNYRVSALSDAGVSNPSNAAKDTTDL
jgi:hypothetical protein